MARKRRAISRGYQCNLSGTPSRAKLTDPPGSEGAFKGLKPGDTIEVHWVHSSCDVEPGACLGACLSDACANPELRVEAQVFIVVNAPEALPIRDFGYPGYPTGGKHQASSLPTDTGTPVVFAGSTTGPSYSDQVCSPLQVTWSVRWDCTRLVVETAPH